MYTIGVFGALHYSRLARNKHLVGRDAAQKPNGDTEV